LAASYLTAGFVHGVLNSDNINVTGESFDYGPWRFTPEWDPDFTAAYFDHYGLYAFGRQPEAIHWNLAQLAGCLAQVGDSSGLSESLSRWSARFEEALIEAMLRRLGIARSKDDREMAASLIAALATREASIDRVFFDWRGGPRSWNGSVPVGRVSPSRMPLDGHDQSPSHAYWSGDQPCSMHIDEVEAIWSAIAEKDDWQPFNDKVTAVRQMGEAMKQDAPTG
jgi:Uncharacterized conserved protein